MSFDQASRREFLAAAGALAACAGGITGRSLLASGGPATVERKDVRDLQPAEIDKYREAFRRIEAREPRPRGWVADTPELPSREEVLRLNKRSYTYWAMLHTYFCPHGNWWFLPWHRAYLYYFERVLQDAVRDYKPEVPPPTIPYWNWTEQRTVPTIFQGALASNPLGSDRRFFQGLREGDVGERRLRSSVDEAPTFSLFGSPPGTLGHQTEASPDGPSDFEEGPHGMVHVFVGYYDGRPTPRFPRTGRPGDFRTPITSALDPIFWSHHANIDRLWNRWLANGRHLNPRDDVAAERDWGRQRFTEFVDGDGTPVDRSVREIVDDPLIRAVVYRPYSGGPRDAIGASGAGAGAGAPGRGREREVDDAPRPREGIEIKATTVTDEPTQLRIGRPQTLVVPLTDQARERLTAALRPATDDRPAEPVQFSVRRIRYPADFPAVEVRAFLNKPDARAETPETDPHFISNFTFFGASMDHAADAPHRPGEAKEKGHGAGQGGGSLYGHLFNLGPAIRRLEGEIRPGQPLRVTLVLAPLPTPGDAPVAVAPDLTLPYAEAALIIGQSPGAARR